MPTTYPFAAAALASLAALALAPAAQAAAVYSLDVAGGRLVSFDTATPGTVSAATALTGATTSLGSLDFRPADGMLYGYNFDTGGIYTVNTATGVTTLVSTSTNPVSGRVLGMDFNPTVDRLRLVTADNENRRIDVTTGTTLIDGALAYGAGDAQFGADPAIADVAYTNSDTNPATGTALFYIDFLSNTLVRTTNPNAGVLTTVGSLGLDVDEFLGFDILTDFGVNTAYASLRVAGVNGLYTIDLLSGAATLLGGIGYTSPLTGLAVALGNPVPEPGTLALVAVAGLAAFSLRRQVNGAGTATGRSAAA